MMRNEFCVVSHYQTAYMTRDRERANLYVRHISITTLFLFCNKYNHLLISLNFGASMKRRKKNVEEKSSGKFNHTTGSISPFSFFKISLLR